MAATAVRQAQTFDWRTAGAVEILPLIPLIRENRFGIDPPLAHDFVLRLNETDYFVKFPLVRAGVIFSPNLGRAYHCEHLIEAATFAKFISERLPLSLNAVLFVEAVKKASK